MSVDNSYQPAIYKEMGGNKLVVKSNGTIEVAGILTFDDGATVENLPGMGYIPEVPSDGQYILDVTGGTPTWVAETGGNLPTKPADGRYILNVSSGTATWLTAVVVPTLPTGDGDYVLHIDTGVATWVAA